MNPTVIPHSWDVKRMPTPLEFLYCLISRQ